MKYRMENTCTLLFHLIVKGFVIQKRWKPLIFSARPGALEPKVFPYNATTTERKKSYTNYYTGETTSDVLNRLKSNAFEKSILIYNIDTLGLEAWKFSDIISKSGDKTPLEIFYKEIQNYVLMGFVTFVVNDIDIFTIQRTKMIELLKDTPFEKLRESQFNRACVDLLNASLL